MKELKPCQFCGGNDVVIFYEEDKLYHFYCPKCDKHIYIEADSKEHAIELFNTRADNWISVDEPPKEKDNYFIHYSKVVQIYTLGKIKTGVYEFDTGEWYDEAINEQITKPEYWQPLPEPPKENSKVYGGIKNEND